MWKQTSSFIFGSFGLRYVHLHGKISVGFVLQGIEFAPQCNCFLLDVNRYVHIQLSNHFRIKLTTSSMIVINSTVRHIWSEVGTAVSHIVNGERYTSVTDADQFYHQILICGFRSTSRTYHDSIPRWSARTVILGLDYQIAPQSFLGFSE